MTDVRNDFRGCSTLVAKQLLRSVIVVEAEKLGVSEKQVPGWSENAEKCFSYRFEQRLFMKAMNKSERYIGGPLLVRALGVRP